MGLLRLSVIPLAIIYLSFRLAGTVLRILVFTILDLLCLTLDFFVVIAKRLPETSVAVAKTIPPLWNVWVALPLSRGLHYFAKWYICRLRPRLDTCARKLGEFAKKTWVTLVRFGRSTGEALVPVAKLLSAIGKFCVIDLSVWLGQRGNMLCSLALRCLVALGKGLWRDFKDFASLLFLLTKKLLDGVILPVAKMIVKGAAQLRPILQTIGTTLGTAIHEAYNTVLGPSAVCIFRRSCIFLKELWKMLSALFTAFQRGLVGASKILSYMVTRAFIPVCLYIHFVLASLSAFFWGVLPTVGAALRRLIGAFRDDILLPIARLIPKAHLQAVKVSAHIYSVIRTITLGVTHAVVIVSSPIIVLLESMLQFILFPLKAMVLGLAPWIAYIASVILTLLEEAYVFITQKLFPGFIYHTIETANLLAILTKPVFDAVVSSLVVCGTATQYIVLSFSGRLAVAIRRVDIWMAEKAAPFVFAARETIAQVAEQAVEKCKQMMVDYIKRETSAT